MTALEVLSEIYTNNALQVADLNCPTDFDIGKVPDDCPLDLLEIWDRAYDPCVKCWLQEVGSNESEDDNK